MESCHTFTPKYRLQDAQRFSLPAAGGTRLAHEPFTILPENPVSEATIREFVVSFVDGSPPLTLIGGRIPHPHKYLIVKFPIVISVDPELHVILIFLKM